MVGVSSEADLNSKVATFPIISDKTCSIVKQNRQSQMTTAVAKGISLGNIHEILVGIPGDTWKEFQGD